jgi:hypothetical protein
MLLISIARKWILIRCCGYGWVLGFEDIDLKIDNITCEKLSNENTTIYWGVTFYGFDFTDDDRHNIHKKYSGSIDKCEEADYTGISTSTRIYLADLYQHEICHFDVSIQFRYDEETGFGDNSNYFEM